MTTVPVNRDLADKITNYDPTRPALFFQVNWRDSRRLKDRSTHGMRTCQMSRKIPDKPSELDDVSGFAFAEWLIDMLVTHDLHALAQEQDKRQGMTPLKHTDVLCSSRECKKPAKGGVVWYPFDPSKWSGHGIPQMLEPMPDLEDPLGELPSDAINEERITMGIPVMTWCGVNPACKVSMSAFLFSRYMPLAQKHQLTGGTPYCWQCGHMEEISICSDDQAVHGVWCTACDTDGQRHIRAPRPESLRTFDPSASLK